MRIRIVSENYYEHLGDYPKPGVYYLEPAENHTLAQLKTFHLLLEIYFNSGAFSYDIKTLQEFKDYVKINYGAGYKKFVYVTMNGNTLLINECKYREQIPKEALAEYGILKSCSEYTKVELTRMIKTLVNEMIFVGVNTARFNEILKEMNT